MPTYQIYANTETKTGSLAVTGANTYYSKPLLIDGLPASVHIVWTQTVATLTGAFTLWYSNKPGADATSDTDWVQDTTFPAPTVSGSGKAFISISQISALYVRLKYVNSGGSGTLVCYGQTANPH